MGDVSAKDGSQETCLNLIGSIFGILLLSFVADNETLARLIFILCIVTHLFANYKAVKALTFTTLNKERLLLNFIFYLRYNTIEDYKKINLKESVFLGFGVSEKDVCGFHIKLGCSFNDIIKTETVTNEELNFYETYYSSRFYMIIINKKLKTIFILLKSRHKDYDVLLAFYHSLLLGISACIDHKIQLEILEDKKLPNSLITKILSNIESNRYDSLGNNEFYYTNKTVFHNNRDFENIVICENLLSDTNSFLKVLPKSGWVVDRHNLPVGKWRGIWGSDLTNKEM